MVRRVPKPRNEARSTQKHTDLSYSHLDLLEIDSFIYQFSFITALQLDYNQLTCIPEEIKCLTHLQLLNLYNNKLEDINNVCSLDNLHTLVVSYNCLKSLPEKLFTLPHLRVLHAAHNLLETLPDTIGCAKKLRTFDVCHNKIKWVPRSIKRILELESVRLNDNNLTMLPFQPYNIGYYPNPLWEHISAFRDLECEPRLYGLVVGHKFPSQNQDFYYLGKEPQLVRIGGTDRITTSIDPALFEEYIAQQSVSGLELSGRNMLQRNDLAYDFNKTELPQNTQECLSLKEFCGRKILKQKLNIDSLPQDIQEYLSLYEACSFCGSYFSDYNCISIAYGRAGNKNRHCVPIWTAVCSSECVRNNGGIYWRDEMPPKVEVVANVEKAATDGPPPENEENVERVRALPFANLFACTKFKL